MIAYIKQVAALIIVSKEPAERFRYTKALSEELDRLDPREFLPEARFPFVRCRTEARHFASLPGLGMPSLLVDLARDVDSLVEKYQVARSGPAIRSFRWLSAVGLSDIIARDYAELSNVLLPDGAWKSTVIMAGSILEAILLDLLTLDPTRFAAAKKRAPRPHGTELAPSSTKTPGRFTTSSR